MQEKENKQADWVKRVNSVLQAVRKNAEKRDNGFENSDFVKPKVRQSINETEFINGLWEDSPNNRKNIVEKSQLESVENDTENGIIKVNSTSGDINPYGKTILDDIEIYKSIGAKSKNYGVMDLTTGEMFNFVEGTKIQNVEVFAGNGTNTIYRNANKYAEKYGGNVEDWQHVKGIGWLETFDGNIKAEVHWSQCENIGKFDFFVKRWLE